MIDSKVVMSQTFQFVTIIENLSLSWKDFKIYMKNKRKEMGLEDLIVRLRIEEDNQIFEKNSKNIPIESKENLVEHKTGQRYKARHDKKNQVHMIENEKLATNVLDIMLSIVMFEANIVDNPK
ncbi:hypothetical protein AAG906_016140 [Vitis piasezkii]